MCHAVRVADSGDNLRELRRARDLHTVSSRRFESHELHTGESSFTALCRSFCAKSFKVSVWAFRFVSFYLQLSCVSGRH